MRFRTRRHRRSASWWGVFCCALLLVGAYVLFDILDIDGSQMVRSPGHSVVAVSPEEVAERLVRPDLTLNAYDLVPSIASPGSAPVGPEHAPASALTALRHARVFPRVNLHTEAARSSSQTSDPV